MRLLRLVLVALALLLAIAPLPARLIEAWYSQRLYPAIQTTLTPLSNKTSISILDAALVMLVAALGIVFVRRVRAAGFLGGILRALPGLLVLAAGLYLVFLFTWGLNYRRLPLDQKLEFDRGRITPEGVRKLADHAVRMVNATYARAHALDDHRPALSALEGPGLSAVEGRALSQVEGPVPSEGQPSMEEAFASAQRMLGSTTFAVPGVPKRSLLQLYFRMAGIDGMTDPFFLEITINPDALSFERPFITLHEWAHLAGYAHEAEANFVAWLACTQGDDLARYSGWLAIYEHASASLPRQDRAALRSALDPGVIRDLQASAARYARSTPLVRDAARDVYDGYLRANRVEEGIRAYSAVTRLIVGAGLEQGESPRLRSSR